VTAPTPASDDLLRRWRLLAAADEPDLFEGALLVSLLVDPAEDVDAARRTVAGLVERVRRSPFGAGVDALRRVLFEEEGFSGDRESYDDPSNSSVARVLSRRRGMPITLSVVTVEVGRRAGIAVEGVGLPGHFVVGGPALGGAYLDPFDGGVVGDPEQLAQRLSSIFGAPVALGGDALRPDSPREILARVLLNLRRSWEKRHRWEEALAALDFSDGLVPPDAERLKERGLLLVRAGRKDEGVAALERWAAGVGEDEAEAAARLVAAARGGAGGEEPAASPRVFTLDEARALMPRVQEITAAAVERYGKLPGEEERREVAEAWVKELAGMGLEIKGLWLVDFDSGAGYYCWKYPEKELGHFHSYEEGFAGRLPLT
jgi:regulator of sirC expression with transglutaminase-like and TPR domain